MPDLVPKPRFDPPSRWDHILAHSGTFAASLAWIVYGTLIALPGVLSNDWEPSLTLALLPEPLALVNGAALIVAGAATAWSIQTQYVRLDRVWDGRRAALVLAIAGWLAHVIAVLVLTPEATVSWSMGLTHCLIALLSLVALSRTEQAIRENMRDQGMDA